MKSTIARFICRILTASLIVLPWQAQAGMIATDQALGDAQAKVAGFVERSEVAAHLERFGLSQQVARERVAALTDAQVAEIAGRIDALPAGGNSVLALVVIFFLIWHFFLSDSAKAKASAKPAPKPAPEKK